jgi:hypothetical protein
MSDCSLRRRPRFTTLTIHRSVPVSQRRLTGGCRASFQLLAERFAGIVLGRINRIRN